MKLVRALLQSLGSSRSRPSTLQIFDTTAVAELILGRETVTRVQAELDYQFRIEQAERLIELRKRELAAKATLDSLR